MIVFVEGLSKAGKSTLIKLLLQANHSYISFKGVGQVNFGMGQRWIDYNFYMHNVIERLDELNDYKKIILWDRGLTEGVYGNSELLRVAKVHKHKIVLRVVVPFHVLLKRNTLESKQEIQLHNDLYEKELSRFDVYNVKPVKRDKYMITDSIVNKVISHIQRNQV